MTSASIVCNRQPCGLRGAVGVTTRTTQCVQTIASRWLLVLVCLMWGCQQQGGEELRVFCDSQTDMGRGIYVFTGDVPGIPAVLSERENDGGVSITLAMWNCSGRQVLIEDLEELGCDRNIKCRAWNPRKEVKDVMPDTEEWEEWDIHSWNTGPAVFRLMESAPFAERASVSPIMGSVQVGILGPVWQYHNMEIEFTINLRYIYLGSTAIQRCTIRKRVPLIVSRQSSIGGVASSRPSACSQPKPGSTSAPVRPPLPKTPSEW